MIDETHFFIYFAAAIVIFFVIMLSVAVVQSNKEDKKIREFGGNVEKNIVQQVMSAFNKQDANKVIEENKPVFDDVALPPDPEKDTDGDGVPDIEDIDIDGDGLLNSQDPDANGDGVLEKTPDSICVQEYGAVWMCATNLICGDDDQGASYEEGKWCSPREVDGEKLCTKCDIPFVCEPPKCKMNESCYDNGYVLNGVVCNNSFWNSANNKTPNEICVQEYGVGWMCETNLICGEGNEEVSYEEGSWCNPRVSDGKRQCAKCGISFVCELPKCKKNKDCYDNGYALNDVVCNNTIWSPIPKVNLTRYFKFNLSSSDEGTLSSSGTVGKPYNLCAQANSLKSYLKFNIPFELSKINKVYFIIWKNDARPMKLKLYKISNYENLSSEDWNVSKQFIADIPQILASFSLDVSDYIDSQTVASLIEANDYLSSQSCFYSSQVYNENVRPKLQLLSDAELNLS